MGAGDGSAKGVHATADTKLDTSVQLMTRAS